MSGGDAQPAPDRLRERFRTLTGRPPAVVAVAPGRVNVIGEHTDYNDGFVLPLALPLVTRVAGVRRDDGRLRLVSLQAAQEPVEVTLEETVPGTVEGWAAYAVGAAWALRQRGVTVPGADLVVDGNVPTGAGLSSSAALECAVALALARLSGADLDGVELARVAQQAENDFVGVPCGIMDQMASTMARQSAALFLDTRSMRVRHVPLALEEHGLVLLVVDPRVQHALADGAYADRRRACEGAATALGVRALRDVEPSELDGDPVASLDPVVQRRVHHVVTENARVLDVVALLDSGEDPASIGPLLTASHLSLRDDYEVSSPELDLVVDTALELGAHGARMTGAGFGGSAVALLPADRADAVQEAVREAFVARGWTEPAAFPAVPSAGAHLEDVASG